MLRYTREKHREEKIRKMVGEYLRSSYKVLLIVAATTAVSYCGYRLYQKYTESSEVGTLTVTMVGSVPDNLATSPNT